METLYRAPGGKTWFTVRDDALEAVPGAVSVEKAITKSDDTIQVVDVESPDYR